MSETHRIGMKVNRRRAIRVHRSGSTLNMSAILFSLFFNEGLHSLMILH